MKFYDNIFSAAYYGYSHYKNESPRLSAVIVVALCQILLLFLIATILKVNEIIDVFKWLPDNYYFIPLFALWIVFLLKIFYKSERVSGILDMYRQKEIKQRQLWGVITVCNIVIPIIIIAILFTK